jgi:hypothetical protein
MKIMRIDYLLSSLALAAFIWFGCSDPVSNPVLPPDPNREGRHASRDDRDDRSERHG